MQAWLACQPPSLPPASRITLIGRSLKLLPPSPPPSKVLMSTPAHPDHVQHLAPPVCLHVLSASCLSGRHPSDSVQAPASWFLELRGGQVVAGEIASCSLSWGQHMQMLTWGSRACAMLARLHHRSSTSHHLAAYAHESCRRASIRCVVCAIAARGLLYRAVGPSRHKQELAEHLQSTSFTLSTMTSG